MAARKITRKIKFVKILGADSTYRVTLGKVRIGMVGRTSENSRWGWAAVDGRLGFNCKTRRGALLHLLLKQG